MSAWPIAATITIVGGGAGCLWLYDRASNAASDNFAAAGVWLVIVAWAVASAALAGKAWL